MNIDKLILGSNPLYGVDHFSSERARERMLHSGSARVMNVIKAATSAGATGFNFSPHPFIFDALRRLSEEGSGGRFALYPMIPDTQSYVTAQLNSGTTGMVRQLLGDLGVASGARALIQGGLSWLTTDPLRAMKLYLDIEIKKVTDVAPGNSKIKVVFGHEMLSDLALAFKAEEILKTFVDHLHDKYGIQAGFVTRNFPRFVEFCEESHLPLKDLVLMTPFNKIGFQMTPTKESCERALMKLRGENVIAMSVLAGGQITLEDSIAYLRSTGIRFVCVGVSSQSHAKETFEALSRGLKD